MFEFTKDNVNIAYHYIDKKITNDSSYLDSICNFDLEHEKRAKKSLYYILNVKEGADPKLLLEWCNTYLSTKQFEALRAAIRKKKSRQNQRTTIIEIPMESYYGINELAVQSELTIKDYLIQLIERERKKNKPPFAQLKKQRKKNV
jgi:macrodomain Ter protein organizer (MatP/YcbG family)